RKVLLVPVSNIADLCSSEQLRKREFWTRVEHPELGRQITYPGAFAKLSRTPIRYRRRPPLLGEHAYEVLTELRPAPVECNAGREEVWPPALKGLKVLDFTWVYAGPASVRYLADYGATVIHIESAKKMDTARTVGPYKDGRSGIERAAIYCNLHVGRYGLSLNLSTSKGRRVAMQLVKWADVVIENFSPKVMRSWGMDYESLRKIKPDLIMVSACLNGQTGPDALLAGYGTMGACMAGFGELTGWPDRAPAAPFGAYTDVTSPKFIAAALLAALDYKRRTGQGEYIDVSQVEAPIQLLARAVLDYTVNGRVQTRTGNALQEYAPTGVYPCVGRDQWVALAAPTEGAWRALCNTAARGWQEDQRFTTASARLENRAALDEAIATWTTNFAPDTLEGLLQSMGVPVHRVATSADIFTDPQLSARGHIAHLEHPRLGAVPIETSRMRFSRTPAAAAWCGPEIGQHNEYVLREILQMTDQEIAELMIDETLE
ncbi:MAG: CoA transferase, partial [Deltaproteobacteria bacterium]|nr:CoA transferase [Deltaproteobacteria bacterium]